MTYHFCWLIKGSNNKNIIPDSTINVVILKCCLKYSRATRDFSVPLTTANWESFLAKDSLLILQCQMKLESRETSAQTGFKYNSWRTEDIFVAPAVLRYEMNNYEGEWRGEYCSTLSVHTDLRILYCILKPWNMCSFVMAFIANVDIFSEGQEIKRKIKPPTPSPISSSCNFWACALASSSS